MVKNGTNQFRAMIYFDHNATTPIAPGNHWWRRFSPSPAPLRVAWRSGEPELRDWGARPPRVSLAAPSRPAVWTGGSKRKWRTLPGGRGFPRGRGKLRPRRARSPFGFGVQVQFSLANRHKGGCQPGTSETPSPHVRNSQT
jgi:hypothetical protein